MHKPIPNGSSKSPIPGLPHGNTNPDPHIPEYPYLDDPPMAIGALTITWLESRETSSAKKQPPIMNWIKSDTGFELLMALVSFTIVVREFLSDIVSRFLFFLASPYLGITQINNSPSWARYSLSDVSPPSCPSPQRLVEDSSIRASAFPLLADQSLVCRQRAIF